MMQALKDMVAGNHGALVDAIIENIPGGILVYEAMRNREGSLKDLRLRLVNRNMVDFTAIPAEDFRTQPFTKIAATIGFPDSYEKCLHVMETGQSCSFEQLIAVTNKWVSTTIVKVDDGVLIKMNDINERKINELQLAEKNRLLDSVFNSSLIGISILHVVRDEQGEPVDLVYRAVNDTVRRGSTTREELFNSTYLTLYPESRNIGLWDKMLQVINHGDTLHFQQYYKGSDVDAWFEIHMARLDEDHLIVHSQDITEAIMSKLKMEEMVEELKRSNKNLQEFAMVASHDLQEPLRKVQYFMNYLQEKSHSLTKDELSIVDRAAKAAFRMRDLINDLLAYSRVGSDQGAFTPVPLNEIVNTVVSDLEPKLLETNGIVQVQDLPAVLGDQQQVFQLFQNLMGNAVKFAHPERALKIEISSSLVRGDQSPIPLPRDQWYRKFWFIRISDNGIGFSQEYAERIFNMFQRLHGNTEYEGTGIGLAIVKKVMDNHKGFIDAVGEQGAGATFRILFPHS